MTESNNNEMKELVERVRHEVANYSYDFDEENQLMARVNVILTLCRTHFGKMWWEEIEKEKKNFCVDNGEIGHYNKDIKRILMGEGNE